MNAHSRLSAASIRIADLADRRMSDRIDGFVAEYPRSTVFHRPQWSQSVEQGCGQKSLYLIAENSGGLVGCLPLSAIRSRLFGNALVSTGFGTGGGAIAETDEIALQLAEYALKQAEQGGFASVELRGGAVPQGWTRTSGVYAGFARSLPATESELLASIPRRQRAEVRRSRTFGLEVSSGRDDGHCDAHFRVYAESVRNLGSPVYPKKLFKSVLEAFGNSAEVLIVSMSGRPLATLLNLYFKESCLPYWGGGTLEGRQWRANDLVWFEAMKGAVERGCGRIDFGRSKIGTGPWSRKRIWGFEEQPLVYSVGTVRGRDSREINPLSARYRLQVAAWQKLPLPIANRLGPLISRGLG